MKNVLIENIVKRMLLEYGGVSDDVTRISNTIFSEIQKRFDCCDTKWIHGIPYKEHPLQYKHICFKPDVEGFAEIGHLVDVTLYLYLPNEDAKEFERFIVNSNLYNSAYNISYKKVILTFVWPINNDVESYTKTSALRTINHELKHALQYSKNRQSSVSSQYVKAREELHKDFFGDTTIQQIVNYTIPWIYYRFDRTEIDAWMQEMYAEATEKQIDIQKTNVYKALKSTIGNYNALKGYCRYYPEEKEAIYNSIRRIDEPKNYFALCDKNVAYLTSKMRRVVGRWQEDNAKPNGSFKDYASNEIEPTSPFNNPNWKYGLKDRIKAYLRKLANRR